MPSPLQPPISVLIKSRDRDFVHESLVVEICDFLATTSSRNLDQLLQKLNGKDVLYSSSTTMRQTLRIQSRRPLAPIRTYAATKIVVTPQSYNACSRRIPWEKRCDSRLLHRTLARKGTSADRCRRREAMRSTRFHLAVVFETDIGLKAVRESFQGRHFIWDQSGPVTRDVSLEFLRSVFCGCP